MNFLHFICKKFKVSINRNKDNFGKFTYDLLSQNSNSFSERSEPKSNVKVFKNENSTTINKNKNLNLKNYNLVWTKFCYYIYRTYILSYLT